mgnify:CR=1 FL=1
MYLVQVERTFDPVTIFKAVVALLPGAEASLTIAGVEITGILAKGSATVYFVWKYRIIWSYGSRELAKIVYSQIIGGK